MEFKNGIWGLSRIVQEADGGFTTSAYVNRIARDIYTHYPPKASNGLFAVQYALVRLQNLNSPDANTSILYNPRIDGGLDGVIGAKTSIITPRILQKVENYFYTDWQGIRLNITANALDADHSALSYRQLFRLIAFYLQQSIFKNRPPRVETHNTEHTDDFSTDPFAGRWAQVKDTSVWDNTNNEVDAPAGHFVLRFDSGSPGSMEHEAQATFINEADFGGTGGGGACRIDNAGAIDVYGLSHDWDADTYFIHRWDADSRQQLATAAGLTHAQNDFVTSRLAAEGGNGANVVLSAWWQGHGGTKPSDPGWIGADGSPDATHTDSDAIRLDDSSAHDDAGITGLHTGTNGDSRTDFFKMRAITDRGGAPAAVNTRRRKSALQQLNLN